MENDGFSIEISFYPLSLGAGFHPKSINFEILSEQMGHEFQNYSMTNYIHFDAAGYLNANFKFPEYDMTQYNEYHEYYKLLQKLIETHWNYETARKELPDKETLIISNKLDRIITALKTIR